MVYLHMLTLENMELIVEEVTKFCTTDPVLQDYCVQNKKHQNVIKLLVEMIIDFYADQDQMAVESMAGKSSLYLSESTGLSIVSISTMNGISLSCISAILRNIRNIINHLISQDSFDHQTLFKYMNENIRCFDKLESGINALLENKEYREELFHNLFDISPFGIFICKDKKLVYANAISEQITGYSKEELYKTGFCELICQTDLASVQDLMFKYNNSSKTEPESFECKINNKAGQEVWLEMRIGKVAYNGSGCIIATATDISARKKIERDLLKSEGKYRRFFNMSPDMTYLFDIKEDLIIEANPVMLNTLGVSPEEIKYKNLRNYFVGDNIQEVEEAFSGLSYGKELRGLEIKVRNAYGEDLDFEINCTPIVELGEYNKALCLARNITERKKIEELKLEAKENIKLLNEVIEHDKIKTEFFSNLSHELRTPLNVILGTLQLMDLFNSQSKDSGMDRINKYCKIMRQNCYRLLRLVNNLIDINKLDAGYMYLNMDNHDIVSIVNKITASVKDYIEDKGIRFNYESTIDSMILACDPDKIERIMLNLFSNAMKFTDCGGSIDVKLWNKNDCFCISVKDTGIGIPKEKQDLVFKRFAQIESSLSRNYHGSGIGLSLVKSLIEMHGGKISLNSKPGAGCEFIIELPAVHTIVADPNSQGSIYNGNNKIEVINIEFSDIYA